MVDEDDHFDGRGRACGRGDDQIEPAHWDGLPDGTTRRTTTRDETAQPATLSSVDDLDSVTPPVLPA